MFTTTRRFLLSAVFALAACQPAEDMQMMEPMPPVADDLDLKESDFECILRWDKVRKFRITNKLGKKTETLDVANSTNGGAYPVGTIIQLVPSEAMVKRKAGWNPASNDWEFFFLEVSKGGTVIKSRGTTETANQFGGNCMNCHKKAAPRYDLVCENTHGCDPLPAFVTPDLIEALQTGDLRCP